MSETGLLGVEPVVPPERVKPPVDKTFRAFEPDQILLMPPSLNEWLPEDHLGRFVAELVDGVLDLSPIYADYTEVRGRHQRHHLRRRVGPRAVDRAAGPHVLGDHLRQAHLLGHATTDTSPASATRFGSSNAMSTAPAA